MADLTAFWVMRGLLRAVRDHDILGLGIASGLQQVLPRGILSGWQFAAALFVGLLVTGNYGPGDRRRDARRILTGCGLATALPLWMTIWTSGIEVVAAQYALTTLLVCFGIVLERHMVDRVVSRFRASDKGAARTLFVGPGDECRRALEKLPFTDRADYRVLGFVDTQKSVNPEALGHVGDFARVLHESDAETVVVCGYFRDGQFKDVVDAALAAGCHILSVPRAIQIAGVEPTLVSSRGQVLIELTAPTLRGRQLAMKRLMDPVCASLALVVLAPLMGAIALAVRLDSKGPVFFRQERVGAGGRRFRILKFRTMRHGASEEAHRALVQGMLSRRQSGAGQVLGDGRAVYKLVNDDRVTRIGHWLRRTSLDELPQLINVLKGDMSLVGPRPPLPYECDVYDFWQYDRLQVRPGITGLWQVSGRNLLTYHQMCELDIEYVRRWSLWLDVRILLKTIPAVLLNSGKAR